MLNCSKQLSLARKGREANDALRIELGTLRTDMQSQSAQLDPMLVNAHQRFGACTVGRDRLLADNVRLIGINVDVPAQLHDVMSKHAHSRAKNSEQDMIGYNATQIIVA